MPSCQRMEDFIRDHPTMASALMFVAVFSALISFTILQLVAWPQGAEPIADKWEIHQQSLALSGFAAAVGSAQIYLWQTNKKGGDDSLWYVAIPIVVFLLGWLITAGVTENNGAQDSINFASFMTVAAMLMSGGTMLYGISKYEPNKSSEMGLPAKGTTCNSAMDAGTAVSNIDTEHVAQVGEARTAQVEEAPTAQEAAERARAEKVNQEAAERLRRLQAKWRREARTVEEPQVDDHDVEEALNAQHSATALCAAQIAKKWGTFGSDKKPDTCTTTCTGNDLRRRLQCKELPTIQRLLASVNFNELL